MKILPLLFLLSLIGCGQKQSLEFYSLKKSDFAPIINNSRAPQKPDLAQVKTILNRDYPIEIALFEDGTWYYDLPNLDDGFGTWEFKNGKIKLEASRDIFDMEIDVVGLDKDAKDIGIYFMDRFGYKTLKVEQIKANK